MTSAFKLLCPLLVALILAFFPLHVLNAQDVSPDQRIYFKGNGTVPHWILEMSEVEVKFTSETEGYKSFTFPHTEPKKDGYGIRYYEMQHDGITLRLEIAEMLCDLPQSNERFPYSANVFIRKPGDAAPKAFEGCGFYFADPNLQHKWLLASIKGKPLDPSIKPDSIPYVQINTSGFSFSGFGGCNTLQGRLFFERHLLRFMDIVMDENECKGTNPQEKFLEGIHFTTEYAIHDDKLVLSYPGHENLVLRRAD